ncbi:MAG: L-serine ammonia-lyase [Clostridia bacterium]|nr:L-serine ammonia-lyase [Clostridia bacterium]
MQSLKELYRMGKGPSSSHTIGPERACKLFLAENPQADAFKAILYGSLAKTGTGHGTEEIIRTLLPNVEIINDETETLFRHPNTMDLEAYRNCERIGQVRVYSVGGGAIEIEGRENLCPEVYSLESFAAIKEYCQERGMDLADYVFECEGEEIKEYLAEVWQTMRNSFKAGVKAEGVLPGGLQVQRKARILYEQKIENERPEDRENRLVCAYAFAVSEENAGGGRIVTAPTCGACGVLPAVLIYESQKHGYSDDEIIRALAAAGVIGNLIKTNASISGAECGCQAEIGSACCMAAAAIAYLFKLDLSKLEYAAEIAMEHHLGLTCDPIAGLVQIPCIERNAVAAMRAINAVSLANFLSDSRKISFDMVVKTMYETGKDMSKRYRETSEGGLAKIYKQDE